MAGAHALVDWVLRACDSVIAACDKIAAATTSVRETAAALRAATEEFRSLNHHVYGDAPIPDDWEQVPAGDGAAQQQRQVPAGGSAAQQQRQVPTGGGATAQQQRRQPPASADHDGSDAAASDDRISCVICMEQYEQTGGERRSVLPACGHMFHSACVSTWLRTSRTCPLCRATIHESAPPAPARARRAMPV
jgi:hypothetical protein